jgi:hypothetical protein
MEKLFQGVCAASNICSVQPDTPSSTSRSQKHATWSWGTVLALTLIIACTSVKVQGASSAHCTLPPLR